MEFYLKEAFQSLKLLEDDFNLTADQGVIDELQSFVADDIEAPAEEEIIDVEADEVEDLQDNYIGKVILECDCCHTRIYKDKEDVIIDEETGLANVEEECPVCSNAFGWNVIGKIEPFKEGEFDKEPEEEEEAEVDEVEISDEEIDEALKEELSKTNLKESLPLREDVEQVKELVSGWLYDHLLDLNDNLAQELHYQIPEYDVDWCNEDGMNAIAEQVNVDMDQYVGSLIDSLFANAPRVESLGEECEKNEECEGEDCDESCEKEEEALKEEFEDPDKVGVDPNRAVEDDVKLETPMENPVEESPKIAVAEGLEDVQSEDAEKLIDPEEEPVKELNEGIENLSLDTEDTHMEMTADEDGRVEVVTEPIHEEEVSDDSDAEMIAPLDAEEISEIDNNKEQSAEEVAIEDEIPEEDEFEIDEFDEESFDEIGESYLHRVYENVNSFNTSNVKYDSGKLVVEGLIKFNSGKEKKTSFMFENFKTTRRGKVVIEGMNDTFSKSKKAFLLKGTLSDKKFVSESLTYNYTVKQINESNESEAVRVYGRAVKN